MLIVILLSQYQDDEDDTSLCNYSNFTIITNGKLVL